MSRKFRMSKEAVSEIEEVLEYTLKEFGQAKFEEYQSLIREAIAAIKRDPLAFPAKSRFDLDADLFTFHIGRRGNPARHLFVYHASAQVTRVSRFLHDSMDLEKHLAE